MSRKLKQVLDKIEENARFVEKERHKVSFSLNDCKAIDAWETNLQLKQTPLATFYESWNKVNLQQMAKRATNSDKVCHITRNSSSCAVGFLDEVGKVN